MHDLASLLGTIQKRTRRRMGAGGSFDTRLRTQKVIYLLKAMGEPTASRYAFNQYVRGPYSPQLARDYYRVQPGGACELSPRIGEAVEEAVAKGNDFLEAAATLHSVWQQNRSEQRARVLTHVARLKPRLEPILEDAWAYLERHGLVVGDGHG